MQVEYSEPELLASHDFAEPLIARRVRGDGAPGIEEVQCHGGFLDDGTYVSPRTKHRVPAIEAWQTQHREQFGTDLLHLPLDTWPESYPNVAQSRYLIESGITKPVVAQLTRIGTVEGFGSMIRYSIIPELRRCFDEDINGTAMTHLGTGLYEAHARDEAGHGDDAGHKEMWFAARDIAFEHPVTEDETALMLERMGIATPGSGGKVDMEALRAVALANRVLPGDIEFELEALIERMVRLLLIEISAFHTFAWAEELLSDTDLVAGDGEAARLVSYIRSDETPHVEYLRTVLSEMRDRTFVGTSGAKHPGTEVIGTIWDRALADSLGPRRQEFVATAIRELEHAVAGRPDAADILHHFHELASAPNFG